MDNHNYDLLPNWMKKFPPNYEILEIPGVEGEINLEAYEEDSYGKDILPFYFYQIEYRSERLDESGKFLRMGDDEKAELIRKVEAWFKKHDIVTGNTPLGKNDESDNYYWAYTNCPDSIMQT